MRALSMLAFAVALLLAVLAVVVKADLLEKAAKSTGKYKFEKYDPKAPKPPRRSDAKQLVHKADGTPAFGSHYDYLVLAVQKCDDYSSWTMHGLWPTDWDDKSKPSHCSNVPFNQSAISDLWPNITKYWETCKWSHTSEDDFLSHEWEKHGTCFGTDEHTYFQTALEIFLDGEWRHECDRSWSKSCQVKVTVPNTTSADERV